MRIVDVGTGSGAIAVALAHAMPRSRVTAVDLFPAALEVARRNAERHGVIDRLTLLPSDLLAAVDSTDFDAVVANPPYIATAEVLEPQVANYEPHSALYAGPTGLEVYERLIPQAAKGAQARGLVMLEIGYGQSPAIQESHAWLGRRHAGERPAGNSQGGSGAKTIRYTEIGTPCLSMKHEFG